MKEGEKRRLYVHPELGYGTTGQLPPNELLIFDIEVVKANSDDAHQKLGDKDSDDDDDDDYSDDEDDSSDVDHDSVGSKATKDAKDAKDTKDVKKH